MTSDRRRIDEVLSSTPRRALALFAAVGTVTGAIAGVIALLPKSKPPPDTLSARFGKLAVYSDMSLKQFDARALPAITGTSHTASTGAISYELAADMSPAPAGPSNAGEVAPTTESANPGEPPTNAPSTTSPAGASAKEEAATGSEGNPSSGSSEGTEPGEGELQTKSSEILYPQEKKLTPKDVATHVTAPVSLTDGAYVTADAGVQADNYNQMMDTLSAESRSTSSGGSSGHEGRRQAPLAPSILRHCRRKRATCGAKQELAMALTYDPNPAKAAEAVAALFNNSRAKLIDGYLYPVGAMVNYNVSLSGFANKTATLVWSMFEAGGPELSGAWLRNIVVARIKPVVNDESLTGAFWVPVPRRHGNYLVHLVLLDSDGVPHAAADAKPTVH